MTDFTVSIDKANVDDDTVTFHISGSDEYGLDKSIMNSLRRTLLSEVPCVGFRVEEGTTKDIHVEVNNSSLHNEFLMHRLSLVPLYIDPKDYEQQYLFYLHVKHDGTEPFRFVTTDDIKVYPLKEGIDLEEVDMSVDNYDLLKPLSKTEHAKIFRPFSFRGKEHSILLTELKNTESVDDFQEILMYGVPSVSNGKEHGRWKVVSTAVYSFLENEELFDRVANEKVTRQGIVDDEERDKFIRSLQLSEGERYYWRDSNDEPHKYNFTITPVHYHRSKDLFIMASQHMIDKLETFKGHLIAMVTGEETTVIVEKHTSENVFKFKVCDQNDTLGSVIQAHVVNHYIEEKSVVNFCGYKKSHPLEEYITFTFALNPLSKVFGKNEESKITAIVKSLEEVIDNLVKNYELIIEESTKKL